MWKAGKKHGEVGNVMQYRSGDKFEGGMADDLRHGEGTYTFACGDMYSGQWSGHKKHGR
jgi:hypothetical protein